MVQTKPCEAVAFKFKSMRDCKDWSLFLHTVQEWISEYTPTVHLPNAVEHSEPVLEDLFSKKVLKASSSMDRERSSSSSMSWMRSPHRGLTRTESPVEDGL